MNVLVSSAGSNTAIGIIKALRHSSAFDSMSITTIDINPFHLCAGALLADFFYQVPYVYEKEKYTKALLKIVVDQKIDCVFSVHDDEISLQAALKPLHKDLCFWAVNDEDIIATCNNKALANKLAIKLGIKVPETFASVEEVADDKFPIIVKPVNGVSSRGIYIAKNKYQLDEFISGNPGKEYVIQQYIKNDAEYTIDTYSHYLTKTFYGGVVRHRIETKDGIATKAVTLYMPQLLTMAKTYLNALNYQGIANMQFIESSGEYYFIEINPRFSGAGILSIMAGFNTIEFTLKEVLGERLENFADLNIKYNYFMTRYWQEGFAYAAGDSI